MRLVGFRLCGGGSTPIATISASTSARRTQPALSMARSMASMVPPAGHVDLDATSFGGYWTHLGPTNWYIDAVLQVDLFPDCRKLHPWGAQ
jgi:hypothetical protein